MNNQNLIIYDNKILYSIFFELKDLLNFQLYFKSQKETFELENKELNNYLILTTTKIENIDNLGLMTVKFSSEINDINLSFINNTIFDIYVSPAKDRHLENEDFNTSSLNLTWTAVKLD